MTLKYDSKAGRYRNEKGHFVPWNKSPSKAKKWPSKDQPRAKKPAKAVTTASKKQAPKKREDLVTDVIFVVDKSGSMFPFSVRIPGTIQQFADAAKDFIPTQDTRFTIGFFNNYYNEFISNRQLTNETDVTTDVQRHYRTTGGTSILDALGRVITSCKKRWLGERHSYLIYLITDGEENASIEHSEAGVRQLIADLCDSYTLAAMVPGRTAEDYLVGLGFKPGNIQLWDASSVVGYENMRTDVKASMSTYNNARGNFGARSVSNLFRPDISTLGSGTVKRNLDSVAGSVFYVDADSDISSFVQKATGLPYVKGNAFYELTKSELVQSYKEVVLVDKTTGEKFGGDEARRLIGLSNANGRVSAGSHGKWYIFIQSTSTNRRLLRGTRVFVKGV